MLDLLLFWEEAGVALAQGTARPPEAGQPGGRAGRGDNAVASPCVGPLSTRSLVTLPSSPWWSSGAAGRGQGPDLWASPAQRLPPQPPSLGSCQARRNWPEIHGQPYGRGGGRAAAGAGEHPPPQLQVGSCRGGNGSVWAGGGGWRPSGRNVNFGTLAGGPRGGVGQEVS